jgi:hypothetical protein
MKQGVICLQVLAVGKEASEAYSKGQRVLFTDLHTQEVGISQQPFPFGGISMLPLQSARMTVLCNGEVSLYPLVVFENPALCFMMFHKHVKITVGKS